MSELVFTWATIIVTQQKVVIQTGQTVPAEDVLATFAHHLRATLVLFNGHSAHGTTLDEVIVEGYTNVILTVRHQATTILLASHIRMPRLLAGRAKFIFARRTLDGAKRLLCTLAVSESGCVCATTATTATTARGGWCGIGMWTNADEANRFAASTRTPGARLIHFDFFIESVSMVLLHEIDRRQVGDFGKCYNALRRALGIGTRDLVSALGNFKVHIGLHALQRVREKKEEEQEQILKGCIGKITAFVEVLPN